MQQNQTLIQTLYAFGNRALPFLCEYYAKLYFDQKHLKKVLDRGGEIFGALFDHYLTLLYFSRLGSENITREMLLRPCK